MPLAAAAPAAAVALPAIQALVYFGHVGLHDAASHIAITVAVTAPVAYFYKDIRGERAEERRKEEEEDRITEGVIIGPEDAVDAMDRTRYGNDAFSFVVDGREVFFMNRDLNHDLHDSMVFSGKLYLVGRGSHQKVQDAYALIKNHNACLALSKELAMSKDEQSLKRADALYKELDAMEKRISKEIPELVRELRRSLNRPRQA